MAMRLPSELDINERYDYMKGVLTRQGTTEDLANLERMKIEDGQLFSTSVSNAVQKAISLKKMTIEDLCNFFTDIKPSVLLMALTDPECYNKDRVYLLISSYLLALKAVRFDNNYFTTSMSVSQMLNKLKNILGSSFMFDSSCVRYKSVKIIPRAKSEKTENDSLNKLDLNTLANIQIQEAARGPKFVFKKKENYGLSEYRLPTSVLRQVLESLVHLDFFLRQKAEDFGANVSGLIGTRNRINYTR